MQCWKMCRQGKSVHRTWFSHLFSLFFSRFALFLPLSILSILSIPSSLSPPPLFSRSFWHQPTIRHGLLAQERVFDPSGLRREQVGSCETFETFRRRGSGRRCVGRQVSHWYTVVCQGRLFILSGFSICSQGFSIFCQGFLFFVRDYYFFLSGTP